MRLVGYLDRFAVARGETVAVRVGSEVPYHLDGVRLIGADTPDGGFDAVEERVGWIADAEGGPSDMSLPLGSYAEVQETSDLGLEAGGSIWVWVCPTLPTRRQAILSRGRGAAGYRLLLDASGAPEFTWTDRTGSCWTISSRVELRPWSWYLLVVSLDVQTGMATLDQVPAGPWPVDQTRNHVEMGAPTDVGRTDASLLIAAAEDPDGRVALHFDGLLEAPTISALATDLETIESTAESWDPHRIAGLLASFDFRVEIPSDRVHDIGPQRRIGRLVNMPTRAATGHRWIGEKLDWTIDASHHGGIHFHADDLEDAAWTTVATISVPDTAPSGIYAIRLVGDADVDRIPFVVPPDASPSAGLLYLLPSFTYLAYGNQHGAAWAPVAARGWPQGLPDPYPVAAETKYAIDQGLKSLYDLHPDGSGVSYASWRRPITNLRPTVNEEPSPDGRGFPHGFRADLLVAGWLQRKGISADIATDDDLHDRGADLLRPYRVVMTGAHPEYWSGPMLDALEAFLAGGGRLVYLGGNGFYWVTSTHPERPHVIEVRRWGATRPWTSRYGEYHHSTTGELGGHWHDRGRSIHRLVGVGFTAQGSGPARPYVRTANSDDPRVSWIFDGVPFDQPIGADGVVMGGAAGLEFDRADPMLGTPSHALVVATARGFTDAYQAALEDVLFADSMQGGTVAPTVHADMVYFETAHDGAVFSTGSIAYGGAVVYGGGENPASRILENVLRTFLTADRLPPT